MLTQPRKLVLIIVVLATNLHAATYFVRAGASGNGTSWSNAWGSPSSISWSTLNAGDTVCIAGGTYSGGITTGKSGTSGHPITLQRATASNPTCGSGTTGWSSSYDAQVNLGESGITIQNSYITITGMVPSGILGTIPNGGGCYVCATSTNTTNVTISYMEISGPCSPSGCNQNSDSRAIEVEPGTQTNWLISYNNLHGQCTNIIATDAPGLVIDHNRIADSIDNTPGNPSCHPNVFETLGGAGQVFSNNEVVNWSTEGILICSNGNCSATVAAYGNVWHDPYNTGVARIMEAQGPGTNGPHLLYNNTIVNVAFGCARTANGGVYASGSAAYNNLIIGSGFNSCSGLPVADYEASDGSTGETHGQTLTSAIFVNYSAGTIAGYHLSGHTNPGLSLGSPYNVDSDGNARSAWDRGAFEYNGSAPPAPPTGLAAVVN